MFGFVFSGFVDVCGCVCGLGFWWFLIFLAIFDIFLSFGRNLVIWDSNLGSAPQTMHVGMVLGIIGATLVFWDWKLYFGAWKIYFGVGNILWVWGIYFVGRIFCGSDICCSKMAFCDFERQNG